MKISSTQPEGERSSPTFIRWKWAWAGLASVFIIGVMIFLYLSQDRVPQEVYIFSFENSLAQIYKEIGSDAELEDLFNSVILASIDESLEDLEGAILPEFYENPLLWDNPTEEEMKFLESELKKEAKY